MGYIVSILALLVGLSYINNDEFRVGVNDFLHLGKDHTVNLVKQTTYEFDKSVTIGTALDNYKYFHRNTQWSNYTSDSGRNVVKFVGFIPAEDCENCTRVFLENTKSIQWELLFQVNTDKSYEVAACTFSFIGTDGTITRGGASEDPSICIRTIKQIYSGNNILNMLGLSNLG